LTFYRTKYSEYDETKDPECQFFLNFAWTVLVVVCCSTFSRDGSSAAARAFKV